ncbi:MAG: hydroxymethylglutaryl-CoA synthase [Candidatus Odinarchaeota archaeon]
MPEVGILGYGGYIPKYRIRVEEIARVWGKDGIAISRGLSLEEKSVPGLDEDTTTISVEAARNALKCAQIDATRIGAIYVGSESHVYATKPTGTVVAEAINAPNSLQCADFSFACKAGTAAMQVCIGLVKSHEVDVGLAIGSDTAQSKPGDALEYAAAAGGAAFLIGSDDDMLASFGGTFSYTSDTPDFWRREGTDFPEHGSRFTGKPAYFRHVEQAALGLFKKMNTKADDYDWGVFHSPNGKFPRRVAKTLGFNEDKIKPSLVVDYVGNTYAGSSPLGLAATLDIARPGHKILVVSYGSGAGSDAFHVEVMKSITEKRKRKPMVQDYMDDKVYIDYAQYAKHRRTIKVE